MTKLKMVPAAVALALCAAAPAYSATGVLFDRNGTSGVSDSIFVSVLDFAAANVLIRNTLGVGSATDPIVPVIYAQGLLGSFQPGGENAATILNPNAEFTFQLGVKADRVVASPTISWTNAAVPGVNFFRLYWDANKDANDITGCGYGVAAGCAADGSQLILEGTISINQANVTDNNLVLGGATSLLDQFNGADNASGVFTTPLAGGLTLDIEVTTYETEFFLTPPQALLVDLALSDQLIAPFKQTNPSDNVVGNLTTGLDATYGPAVDHDSNPVTPNVRLNDIFPTFGPVCGTGAIAACDLHLQGAPTISLRSEVDLPEPTSLALLSLGLFGLGVAGRRLNRNRT